jgi:hypothetical protein
MRISRRRIMTAGVGLAAGGATVASGAAAVADGPPVDPPGKRPPGWWHSELVRANPAGKLLYTERDGRRLPDFGHAGYRAGGVALPQLPVPLRIAPVPGDNSARLREAIDHMGSLPLDANGHRGALLLEAGVYELAETVVQPHSGVVLRGVGDGEDPATSTILRPVGEPGSSRNGLVVGGDGTWQSIVAGTRTDIVTERVAVGAREFRVADASELSVGDTVLLTHPCTQEWLDAVDGGGTGDDAPWEVGSLPLQCSRRITALRGRTVTVDVPLFNDLDRSLSQSYLEVRDRAGILTEVGVEDLRIDVAYDGAQDENVSQTKHALRLRAVEDAWVQRCTVLHFSQSGVVTGEADRVTVRDVRSLDPVSEVDGSMRYNFNVERRSQQILFTDCHAAGARHSFVSNGTSSVTGVVFHRTTATGSLTSSEGHRQWSQGLLFDNHREIEPVTGRTVSLYNRGDYGTGHGWSAAHSVAWNTDTAGTQLIIQQPPTAQNYAIGCFGDVSGDGPFEQPTGWIEGTGRSGLHPESLYEAQLHDRLR